MERKTIVTVTGIRPDFIRMSRIFNLLDENFNHILIHTGQHFDRLLSDVFFEELDIRKPDFNLGIGGKGKEHFEQSGDLSTKLIKLLRQKGIKPDMILFLGDSNSVAVSVPLKKEGYVIGHIEAGMRSGDKRMLEEINRTVCDHCSDYHFVYHDDYKDNLIKENLPADNIHVVGNTIVEVYRQYSANFKVDKKLNQILLDVHRPENFKCKNRLANILFYANICSVRFGIPVKMLKFKRTFDAIIENNIPFGNIEFVDLMSYKQFFEAQFHSAFVISDSGTAQEEPALFKTPVVVPRDFTERPQSVDSNCSIMIDVNTASNETWNKSRMWVERGPDIDPSWLGSGDTATMIIKTLLHVL